MGYPIQSKTLKALRQAIGVALDKVYLGTATAAGSTSTIEDSMLYGGTAVHAGKFIKFQTGANNTGLVRRAKEFDGLDILSFLPVISDAHASGDEYELWDSKFNPDNIDRLINQAIGSVTDYFLVPHEDDSSLVKEQNEYEYTIPTTFVALHELEHVRATHTQHTIHNCNAVWAELTDGDVTASADTSLYKEGGGSLKLVVAAGCEADDILATASITSLDISDCDVVTLWVRSSVAAAAGDLQLLLDNTASCASPVESLDIPALVANTWTPCEISLANPYSDSAIISVGIKYVTDLGACTIRVDDIKAELAASREYDLIPPNEWELKDGATPKIKLTSYGYSRVEDNRKFRMFGYKIASELSADTGVSEIDPEYIINFVLMRLLMGTALSAEFETEDRKDRAKWYAGDVARRKREMSVTPEMNTRWITR